MSIRTPSQRSPNAQGWLTCGFVTIRCVFLGLAAAYLIQTIPRVVITHHIPTGSQGLVVRLLVSSLAGADFLSLLMIWFRTRKESPKRKTRSLFRFYLSGANAIQVYLDRRTGKKFAHGKDDPETVGQSRETSSDKRMAKRVIELWARAEIVSIDPHWLQHTLTTEGIDAVQHVIERAEKVFALQTRADRLSCGSPIRDLISWGKLEIAEERVRLAERLLSKPSDAERGIRDLLNMGEFSRAEALCLQAIRDGQATIYYESLRLRADLLNPAIRVELMGSISAAMRLHWGSKGQIRACHVIEQRLKKIEEGTPRFRHG